MSRRKAELELDNIDIDMRDSDEAPLKARNAEVRRSRLNPGAIAAKLKALISPSTNKKNHPPVPAARGAAPSASPMRPRTAQPVQVMGAPAPRLMVARPQTAPGGDADPSTRGGLLGLGAGKKDSARGRINVFVRVRPMTDREKGLEGFPVVEVANGCDVFVNEFCQSNDYLRQKRIKSRQFTFDVVFGPDSLQESVYEASTATLVDDVLEGRNACCFCYGATGAGKTYTMLGTEDNPGVMIQALQDLFAKLHDSGRFARYQIKLSYLEVYNETVRDLLNPQPKPLELRENDQGVTVSGLSFFEATSVREIMQLLHKGNTRRTTESTRCNATSSRSHAVLQVILEAQTSEGRVTTGKLSLIDLAGSERAIATEARTQRSVEGANINKSLLALSSCISALVEGKKHIPYRNSKLTKLLKDSLGGQCQTAMIANISPCSNSLNETSNTLHWADRAKQIRTKDAPAQVQYRPTGAARGAGGMGACGPDGVPCPCERCAELEAALAGSEAERKALGRRLEETRAQLRKMQEEHVLPSCQGSQGPYPLRSDKQIKEMREMLEQTQADLALMEQENRRQERDLEEKTQFIAAQDALINKLEGETASLKKALESAKAAVAKAQEASPAKAAYRTAVPSRPAGSWLLEKTSPSPAKPAQARARLTAFAVDDLDEDDEMDVAYAEARTHRSPLVAGGGGRQPLGANPRGANVAQAGPSKSPLDQDTALMARRPAAKRSLRSTVTNENEERELYLESPTEKRPAVVPLSARGAPVQQQTGLRRESAGGRLLTRAATHKQ